MHGVERGGASPAIAEGGGGRSEGAIVNDIVEDGDCREDLLGCGHSNVPAPAWAGRGEIGTRHILQITLGQRVVGYSRCGGRRVGGVGRRGILDTIHTVDGG